MGNLNLIISDLWGGWIHINVTLSESVCCTQKSDDKYVFAKKTHTCHKLNSDIDQFGVKF